MNKFSWLFVVLLVLTSSIATAQDVQVGLYILNLGKFDVSTGAFTADFYLDLKCPEGCEEINFEFMNGRAASIEKVIDEPKEQFYRIQANLNSPVDLKQFPFDTQRMEIILEDKDDTIEEVRFLPLKAESGIDPSIVFTGWNIDGWEAKSRRHFYPIYGETYSQYVFSVDISRIALNSFLKTFLPIFFIVLVVMFSFILDTDKITTRLGMAGSSLVASVMFHVSITNQIPPVGYLTFADKVMVLTYFILLASFIINVAILELLERKRTEFAEKVHRRTEYAMFIAVPLLYAGLFVWMV